MSMKNEHLQSLPSVDKLLNARDIQVLKESFGRSLVTEAVRNVLNKERESILKNNNVGLLKHPTNVFFKSRPETNLKSWVSSWGFVCSNPQLRSRIKATVRKV